jgi:hypothetical protein
VFPWRLRVDYSPAERTLVSAPYDGRFVLGLLCFLVWVALIAWAWRRGRRVEAFGLSWIGIALLPVANLFFPVGVLVAERTLYLPSVGLALAAGSSVQRLPMRPLAWTAGVVFAAGAVRAALRVPVWSGPQAVAMSVLRDSPRSYVVPMLEARSALAQHRSEEALAAVRRATGITAGAPRVLVLGADAAFMLGQTRVADSLLTRLDAICRRCPFYYEQEAQVALSRGDTSVAREFLLRARTTAVE